MKDKLFPAVVRVIRGKVLFDIDYEDLVGKKLWGDIIIIFCM